MSFAEIETSLTAVESVFEEEAELIVAGKIIELGQLSTRKLEHLTALTSQIESGGLVNATPQIINRVKRVQATASEHGKHLEAMRFGLERIRSRMGGMQTDTQVGSYNQYGNRVRFTDSVGGFESKA